MMNRPPAAIGMSLDEVDTPALIVDLEALERNLDRLPALLTGSAVRLRPHAKTHKSPVIALMQLHRGAVGVCCQKLAEAEAMVLGGVPDVLISNEVVGKQKLGRLASLARLARIAVCADDLGTIRDIDAAAAAYGATITVLVEIDVGAGRCGVAPGEAALPLVAAIAERPSLRFGGLQAYHGAAQHIRRHDERAAAIARAAELAGATRTLIEGQGILCPTVSGGGTGSFAFELESGVYDELQCGSYVFMDADYARNLDADGAPVRLFEHSLFVWTQVMSRPSEDRIVIDAGLKALSLDSGPPLLVDHPTVGYRSGGDEHGLLCADRPVNGLALADKVRLIPGHCDPTVNLYDWYVGIRGDRVEALWPIAARGAVT